MKKKSNTLHLITAVNLFFSNMTHPTEHSTAMTVSALPGFEPISVARVLGKTYFWM